jgi:protein phosphatase
MGLNNSESRNAQPGGLQSMLARLRGMVQALTGPSASEPSKNELLPTWDRLEPTPVIESSARPPEGTLPVAEVVAAPAGPSSESSSVPQTDPGQPATPRSDPCPACGAPHIEGTSHCENCGRIFPTSEGGGSGTPPAGAVPAVLRERYEVGTLLTERSGVSRFRGIDRSTGRTVSILAGKATGPEPARPPGGAVHDELVPDTDEFSILGTTANSGAPKGRFTWPTVTWEQTVCQDAKHASLPGIVDYFTDGEMEYLVEEVPTGQPLWDAWDNPENFAAQRYGWLRQIAEALSKLHAAGAILEGLRPEMIVVDRDGQARLNQLTDLLPLPLPPNPPIRGTFYTAPELVSTPQEADARADLYSVGATVMALYLGRELTDLDFDEHGTPKPLIDRCPDVHPLLARLIGKTFARPIHSRFPTEEAGSFDPTGFKELIHALEVCARTLDQPRLDIAAWTTTGMVRTGNEDGFAILHSLQAREDDLVEAALVLLADGMGGQENGELAAALALEAAREWLIKQSGFSFLSGSSAFEPNLGKLTTPPGAESVEEALVGALKEANRRVYGATQENGVRRQMGCTAQVVYIRGSNLVVAHVGDSRTYRLHNGEMRQITRDQTWVNRMVDIGAMTQEEAEEHPRRSELMQAIGGHPDVDPQVSTHRLDAGDWVLVCSDGISNYLDGQGLKELLQASLSAENAARRLVNIVNHFGAMDNATVVVIRAH